jgi:hypothetical protein
LITKKKLNKKGQPYKTKMEKKIKAQSLTNQTLNDEFLKIKKTKK